MGLLKGPFEGRQHWKFLSTIVFWSTYHNSIPLISSRIAAQDGKAFEGVNGQVLAVADSIREFDLQILDIVDAR